MRNYFDDPNPGATALVAFVFVVLVAVVLLVLQAYYKTAAGEEFDVKIVEQAHLERVNVLNEQRSAMQEYGWVDQGAGKVRIPIDRAMELVVREAAKESR